MDSVTQIALGAAVSESVIGKKVGNKALLWGAIAGTLPDLDVFIPFDDPIKDFTYHRSLTHSVFFLTLLTPALVWLITRIYPSTKPYRKQWMWAIWLVLVTHPILDCFTIYGTQILWPLTRFPVTWSTVALFDSQVRGGGGGSMFALAPKREEAERLCSVLGPSAFVAEVRA